MDFYKLTIKEIKRQTPSAVTLQFNVPETLEKTFRFSRAICNFKK